MKTISPIFLAVFLLLVYTRPAQAYLDPGSGSMLLQLLLGGIAGVLLALKLFWHHILSAFGIRKKESETKQELP